MIIESLRISNFRCFGAEPITGNFASDVTSLIGGNGSGKTAALVALSRLFGVSRAQRAIVKSDFHLGADDTEIEDGTVLYLEAIFAFPELVPENGDGDQEDDEAAPPSPAVAEFWKQMAASDDGTALKVRVRLQASWIDDGTPDGAIVEDMRWITSMDDTFEWEDCPKVSATDRASVQMIYVPAMRRADEQVKALLRSRLWRAAIWSDEMRDTITENTEEIQTAFSDEAPIAFIKDRLQKRWSQVHKADTDTEPVMRLVEGQFEALIRQTEVKFSPDEAGAERELNRLSDGQKSLFHIALTAATLEVEQDAAALPVEDAPFNQALLKQVPLTILAIEEPENSLSPFFLSRIMELATQIGSMPTAQVVLASHSASIVSRIEPESIRYFRLDPETCQSSIRALTLPTSGTAENAYVRLAVQAYPELYFARFVVLGEGDSEQIVLPKLADNEEQELSLDRSFVPIVPLGGRYVSHFWRLLTDLDIPHATLLDLDLGRQHGGANAIRTIVAALAEIGKDMADTEAADDVLGTIDVDDLDDLDNEDFQLDEDGDNLIGDDWLEALQEYDVYFSSPIDLDFAMIRAYPEAYRVNNPGGTGPRTSDKAKSNRKKTVLKKKGTPDLYPDSYDLDFVWYSYLFMQKSKPASHLSALTRISKEDLYHKSPDSLSELIDHIESVLRNSP